MAGAGKPARRQPGPALERAPEIGRVTGIERRSYPVEVDRFMDRPVQMIEQAIEETRSAAQRLQLRPVPQGLRYSGCRVLNQNRIMLTRMVTSTSSPTPHTEAA